MQVWRKISNRFRAVAQRGAMERELDEELRFHLDMETEKNRAAGLSPAEARRAAMMELGGLERTKEECRRGWGLGLALDFLADVRFGARELLARKGYASIAIATLAIGIGSGAAVFSLARAILFDALPVPSPEELRAVYWSGENIRVRSMSATFQEDQGARRIRDSVSYPAFVRLREAGSELADIFGFAPLEDVALEAGGNAFAANGMIVSENFFSALRVEPFLGSLFAPSAAQPGIVVSRALWRDRLGGDPSAIGRSIVTHGQSYTVVGVLPESFQGIAPGNPQSFYVALSPGSPFLYADLGEDWHWFVRMMARLKPGVGDGPLQDALARSFAAEAGALADDPQILLGEGSAGLGEDRRAYRRPLLLMLGAVGATLLVACANLAGLSLVRGHARRHELALRAALGASRWRLARQSLAESLLLSLLGAGAGILLAGSAARAMSRLLAGSPEGLQHDVSIDLSMLGLCMAAASVVAVLIGLLPALRAGSADPLSGLKSRGARGASRHRLGKTLVVAQICVSLSLLSAAGLYARSLAKLQAIDAGFGTRNLMVFQLNPGSAGYEGRELADYYGRVQSELTKAPGIESVTLTQYPLLSNRASSGGFLLTHKPELGWMDRWTDRLTVSETFFETMGIPILRGRGIESSDVEGAPRVVVVNEAFARAFLPEGDPLGHVMTIWEAQWRIVGVCKDAKYGNIKDPVRPTTYFPLAQRFYGSFEKNSMQSAAIAARCALPPGALISAAQEAVAKVDPNVPLYDLTTQDRLRDRNISDSRLLATLCLALAAVALLLCCIGVYGLVAHGVAQRKGEIAVRMAVGARPGRIAAEILREYFLLAALGLAVGLPAALAVARVIESQLYETQPHEPAVIALVVGALLVVTLCATLIPARRAAADEPLASLRAE